MEYDVKPLLISKFLEENSENMTEIEIEYIGEILLGEDSEYAEVLFAMIEENDLSQVRLVINKIIEEGEEGEEEE